MTIHLRLLLLTLTFSQLTCAQVLYARDGIYIRESNKPIADTGTRAFTEFYYVPFLADSNAQKKLAEKAQIVSSEWEKGKPVFEDMVLLNADPSKLFDIKGKVNFADQPDKKRPGFTNGVPSFRFFVDSAKSYLNQRQGVVYYADVNFENYIRPFYFRRHEVTNKEYREFVSWVRDSILRTLLAENTDNSFYRVIIDTVSPTIKLLDWTKKLDPENKDVKEALNELYLSNNERFYRVKKIDTRKLNYIYKGVQNGKTDLYKINVYPDTLCWIKDFSYSYNEPMTNMYFWHPAYDHYPVVGVTYDQACAYLYWKETEENKKLNAQKKKYRIQLDLPSEIEWEMAQNAITENKQITTHTALAPHLNDNNWKCDLQLNSNYSINKREFIYQKDSIFYGNPKDFYQRSLHLTHTDSLVKNGTVFYIDLDSTLIKKDHEENYYYFRKSYTKVHQADQLFHQAHWSDRYYGNYVVDGVFHTAPADLKHIPKEIINGKKKIPTADLVSQQLDANGISFMGGNVSEWLRDDEKNFGAAFFWRMKYLKNLNAEDAELQANIEQYSNRNNAKGGKLVRGANWFDERFGNKLGRNYSGNTAKTFINPEETHCTLGFRYVIHLVLLKK